MSNPFDVIASFVDEKADYDSNCKKIAEHLRKDEIPMDAVSSVLVSAVGMPSMYAQLVQTQAKLRDCQHDLEECQEALAAYQEHERDDARETKPHSRNKEVVN